MALTHGIKPIVTSGLVLCLDAANRKSYPGTGTAWTDLSGRGNNGTLTNMDGTNFNSANGGSLTFDGSNEFVNCGTINLQQNFSLEIWAYHTLKSFDKNHTNLDDLIENKNII